MAGRQPLTQHYWDWTEPRLMVCQAELTAPPADNQTNTAAAAAADDRKSSRPVGLRAVCRCSHNFMCTGHYVRWVLSIVAICLHVPPCVSPSACLYTRLSVCLCLRLSFHPSVHLFLCPSIRPSLHPSLFFRPSLICLSVHPSVRPSVRLSICLSVSVCQSVRQFIAHSLKKMHCRAIVTIQGFMCMGHYVRVH